MEEQHRRGIRSRLRRKPRDEKDREVMLLLFLVLSGNRKRTCGLHLRGLQGAEKRRIKVESIKIDRFLLAFVSTICFMLDM